jgi:hypothetical protein
MSPESKPYLAMDHPIPLRLLETRTFRNGSVYLRYQRIRQSL